LTERLTVEKNQHLTGVRDCVDINVKSFIMDG